MAEKEVEHWQQIESLFQQALDQPPPTRDTWLRQACGDDQRLLAEVLGLLANHAEDQNSKDWINIAALQLMGGLPPLIPPDTRIGPYEITEVIGAGGMGQVYRARDTRLARQVAIKFCSHRFTESLEYEARAAAALNHPNICAIFDVGPNYLVMEFVEGVSPRGPLPLEEVLRIGRQMADGLVAAHEKGIVHRDLKPGNLKIMRDGTVKILDFGLATVESGIVQPSARPLALGTEARHTLQIFGTAAYMSPEQARGETVDKRTDIWAFGVVLYELITGRTPFKRGDVSETMAAIIKADPPLGDVPRQIRPLLRSCLYKDPQKRLRDIGDVWHLLEEIPDVPPIERKNRFRTLSWILVAVLSLTLGIVLWPAHRGGSGAPMVRLEVDLGADTVLSPTGIEQPSVALSPDGSYLVYSTASQSPVATRGSLERDRPGRGTLFVRRLDQSKPIELTGTEGAAVATFSPDSRWIAFFARGKLSRVSVEGGTVFPIADVADRNSGAVWSEDGYIYIGGSGLMRVPSSGGEPQQVTPVVSGAAIVKLHQLLPEGRKALVVIYAGSRGQFLSADNATIETISLIDGSRKTLLRGGASPRYLPTGHLVYSSKGTFFALPFDLSELEPRGAAVALLNDIQFNTNTSSANLAFSDSGTLVYRKGRGVPTIVGNPAVIESIDSAGKRAPLITEPRPYSRPRFSPDGKRLALLISDSDSRDEWVYDIRRGIATKVTFGGLSISTVAWAQDGRYLVYGNGGTGIHWTPADGVDQAQLLLPFKPLAFVSSYSPAANRLAYFAKGQIFTVPVAAGNGGLSAGMSEQFFESQFSVQEPEFSPDGRWIAYTSNDSGRFEVFVRPFPPEPGQSGRVQISYGGGVSPRWSRTGKELVYRSGDQIISVGFSVKDSFVAERPRVRVEKLGGTEWDLGPDGDIAVVISRETANPPSEGRTVVFLQNFFDEVRRRVPTAN